MASPRSRFLSAAVLLLSLDVASLRAAPIQYQGTELRGTVRDSANRPIPEVEVSLRESPVRVSTDASGRFVFSGLRSDSAHLSLRRVGYRPLAVAVTLQGEGLPALSLVMSPEAYLLAELSTTVRLTKPAKYAGTMKYDGFFHRQKLGMGTFITRDQIERMNAFHTLEILRSTPGIRVDVGNPGDPATADIVMPRCQQGASRLLGKVTVAIDGALQLGSSGHNYGEHGPGSFRLAELLGRISATDIELVEVYRGPGQIPAEFWEPGACGAVAIWTRYGRDPTPAAKPKPGR